MTGRRPPGDSGRLDRLVADTQRERVRRRQGYRARALEILPWVCGRCAREFDRRNVHELTVHHRDHDHDHNPPDGSNWELLCLYCHDQEHSVQVGAGHRSAGGDSSGETPHATQRPFADLRDLLRKKP